MNQATEKTIKESLNEMYNKGIDHSIQTLMEAMKKPHKSDDVFSFYRYVVHQLEKLKSYK